MKYRKEPHYKVLEAHAPDDFINDKIDIGSIGYSFGLESKNKRPRFTAGPFHLFLCWKFFYPLINLGSIKWW
jgi:hypothetical protein